MAVRAQLLAAGVLDAVARASARAGEPVSTLAVDQGVAGHLLAVADRLGDADREAVRVAARAAAGGHLRRLAALAPVLAALRAAGVEHVVLKGPVLQRAWGSAPRSYLDVDVLVRPAELADALALLRRIGAEVVDRNWALLRRERRAQVHVLLADGTPLDLHWHLVNHGPLRAELAVDTDEVLAGATPVDVGVVVPAPAPVDLLLHTAVHCAVSGGHRLVWLADLAALAHDDPDWDAVVAGARRWRAGLPVAAMLERARRTVAAPVPHQVVHALASTRSERSLVVALSRWRPVGNLPGGGSTGRAVARALRPTVAGTLAAAGGEAGALVGRLLDRRSWWLDPDDPRHVRFDSGADGYERYVADAAGTDRLGHGFGRRPAPGSRSVVAASAISC